jgi:hypothetical protein
VFNAGHSERGNDLPVLLSTTKAERVDGGFRFTGHKMFGSLMPVWTRIGNDGLPHIESLRHRLGKVRKGGNPHRSSNRRAAASPRRERPS